MGIELDHFFVFTRPGAPEGDGLAELGLTEGESNDHPGQGTANRRFYFDNAMLELIYVRDAAEASNGPAAGLRFAERASSPGASPFGIIVRHSPGASGDQFPGWRYQPEYFNEGVFFLVGDNSDRLEEPLVICLPEVLPPHASWPAASEPFVTVTGLTVGKPSTPPSATLAALAECDGVIIRPATPHVMEIEVGHGRAGQFRDFRPELPLVLRW